MKIDDENYSMVICEVEPGKKRFYLLRDLEKKLFYLNHIDVYENIFKTIMKNHFPTYIKEEVKEERPHIDMTDAINKFLDEKNPKRLSGNYTYYAVPVNDYLGLAKVGWVGIDFDEYIGCIDVNGNFAIPRDFQISMDYGEGLFATYNSSLVGGYINTKGETVIPFEYDWVCPFENGYAVVKTVEGEVQYIDKTGRPVMRITEYCKINGKDIYGETLEELKENVLKLENTKHKTK